jgi:hypothetical protein
MRPCQKAMIGCRPAARIVSKCSNPSVRHRSVVPSAAIARYPTIEIAVASSRFRRDARQPGSGRLTRAAAASAGGR